MGTDETMAMTLGPQELRGGGLLVEMLLPGNLGILMQLMEEILHQLILWSISHYLQGFYTFHLVQVFFHQLYFSMMGSNFHCFPIVGMVINLVVGVDIAIIRIPN